MSTQREVVVRWVSSETDKSDKSDGLRRLCWTAGAGGGVAAGPPGGDGAVRGTARGVAWGGAGSMMD